MEALVQEGLTEASEAEQDVLEELGLSFMRQTVALKNAVILLSPVEIKPLLEEINFIKDSQKYGLFLRLPVREIPESDYQRIVLQAKR